MNIIVCIDYENVSNITNLIKYSNVKYVQFIGANQKDNLKTAPGTKISKKRIKKVEKDFLDWELILYIKDRLNIKDNYFYIISDDSIFVSFANFINETFNEKRIKVIKKSELKTSKFVQ